MHRYLIAFTAVALVAGMEPAAMAKSLPPAVEGPELARGQAPIGTATLAMNLPNRWMLTAAGAEQRMRTLPVRIWYPAAVGARGRTAVYRHTIERWGKVVAVPAEPGYALPNAKAAAGRYPLLILSHGYGGWNTKFSRLGEALATHGYIVVSITHGDEAFTDAGGFVRSFGNVLLNRAQDQRDVLNRVVSAAQSGEGMFAHADTDRIGLLGYSMGGYGALATAGAAYDLDAKPFAAAPAQLRAAALSPDPATARMIKAVVLVAPWGGQPDNRAWRPEALESVTQPVLMIGGDHDDIVNYKEGIRWIFGGLRQSDRRLLVFREARHNVVGDAVDLGPDAGSEMVGNSLEPVWRQERINSINQHFIAAFFDSVLKEDASRLAYLNVPTVQSGDGSWPVAFGTRDNGDLAGDGQPGYWRGFPRRWALGLEMHHLARGASANVGEGK